VRYRSGRDSKGNKLDELVHVDVPQHRLRQTILATVGELYGRAPEKFAAGEYRVKLTEECGVIRAIAWESTSDSVSAEAALATARRFVGMVVIVGRRRAWRRRRGGLAGDEGEHPGV